MSKTLSIVPTPLVRNKVLRASKSNVRPVMGGAAVPENLTEALDTLYTTTWQLMRNEAVDNIFTATPFWFWLTSKERIRSEAGGRWIGIPILHAKNTTVSSIGKGGVVDITPSDIETTAKYDWKWVAGSVVRLYADDKMNRGQAQIMSKVKADLTVLKLSLIDSLEEMVAGDGSGNGGLDILGIQSLVKDDPTTNPASPPGNIGGIDAANNTFWRNKTQTWDGTPAVSGDSDIAYNFRLIYNACSVGNDHPTLVLTDVTQYERYEANFTKILAPVDAKFVDMGFEALRFKGAAVVFGPSMPAQKAYFLNERYMEFVYDPAAYFEPTEWKSIPNQLDRVMQIVLQGNLVVSNRRMHGVIHTMPST